jgi:hypothetical protein
VLQGVTAAGFDRSRALVFQSCFFANSSIDSQDKLATQIPEDPQHNGRGRYVRCDLLPGKIIHIVSRDFFNHDFRKPFREITRSDMKTGILKPQRREVNPFR